MRTYLDSSGKLESNYLTLAGFAASDELWGEFETQWSEILRNHHPSADYLHMWELSHYEGKFERGKGWNPTTGFELVMKCLKYMNGLDKQRFRMFYCAVDLMAHRKLLKRTYKIPSPIELCNRYCSETVFSWYLAKHPGVVDPIRSIQYYFDINEYFKGPFEEKWRSETKRSRREREWNPWCSIIGIETTQMRCIPGIQAADMIAWGTNREMTQAGGPYSDMAWMMRQLVPFYSKIFDEATMLEEFEPIIYTP